MKFLFLTASRYGAIFLSFALISCATRKGVDLQEPKRVVGTEEDVRIDAQIFADHLSTNALIRVTYDVENRRNEPIAIADIVPVTTYDSETRTITITLGAEIPGNVMLPRLMKIASGEKSSFNANARINVSTPNRGPLTAYPQFLRLQVNFLGDVEPFRALIGIPEKGVADKKMADELFPSWVETNEQVTTNAIPIQWFNHPAAAVAPSAEVSRPGRRRPPG